MIDVNEVPDWVSPPGETILDVLEERGWSQAELAERTGFTRKHVNQLIKGVASITEETALKLERVLGSTAGFWLNREAQYRESLARQAELKDLEPFVPWLSQLPVADMVRFGWITKTTSKVRKVAECLQFFGVATVDAWNERYGNAGVAYRASETLTKKQGSVSAWLRHGEMQSEKQNAPSFDRGRLLALVPHLRTLCKESDSTVFLPHLVELCNSVGVILVVAPVPKGNPVSGATKWLNSERALVMMSFRHKSNYHFWFTFFHEIAHLLLHGKRLLFLEGLENGLNTEQEAEADQWASNVLIPQKSARQLSGLGSSAKAITEFAESVGLPPGIVVGRLQHDGLIPWTALNNLKVFYEWVEGGDESTEVPTQ